MTEELRAAREAFVTMADTILSEWPQGCVAIDLWVDSTGKKHRFSAGDFRAIAALRASTDAGAEPVAWRHGEDGFCWRTFDSEQAAVSWGLPNGIRSKPIPLYAHPPVADAAAVAGEGRYLIRKGGYYYRPNAQGYTTDKAQAGRYSLEDAIRHSHPNGPDGPRDGMSYEPAPALPHPAPAEPVGLPVPDAAGEEQIERAALAQPPAAEPVVLPDDVRALVVAGREAWEFLQEHQPQDNVTLSLIHI